eukprot:CAMPEP_0172495976 /NCGR_PEP_ID=MMETSP1066-20121228/79767_1 /TAXON_ID=671091 /ORGANISM="Coscinodiscus wailesii, Strain CCMP2513" /LENGTH=280 /DNA_ID=CAMNT_0013268009 /DNA_START=201 /DNA_END=1043 /DNA_ORIENTATION=+
MLIKPKAITSSRARTRAYSKEMKRQGGLDDDAGEAQLLPLSDYDRNRLLDFKSRFMTCPILILDAILPGQKLQFGSADPKFRKLLEYVVKNDSGTIGMIGLNPHTGQPLNTGVTLSTTPKTIKWKTDGMIVLSGKGEKRFEIQGEPWRDDSKSFHLAHVEIIEDREEPRLSGERMRLAEELSDRVPSLVVDWIQWVVKTKKCDIRGMDQRIREIGKMPESIKKRALWLAALINPIPELHGVCLEIRPAMLACKNDFDRIYLAVTAIQSSIDHLSGRRHLF